MINEMKRTMQTSGITESRNAAVLAYRPYLYKTAWRFADKDGQLFKDLASFAIEHAYKVYEKCDDPRCFGAYLKRSLPFALHREVKRIHEDAAWIADFAPDDGGDLIDLLPDFDADLEVAWLELEESLRTVLSDEELDLVLYRAMGYSLEQLSMMYVCDPSTILRRLWRIRKRILPILKPWLYEDAA